MPEITDPEKKCPERPAMPEFDPDQPTKSLHEMIEHTQKHPAPLRKFRSQTKERGFTAGSYVEVIMSDSET